MANRINLKDKLEEFRRDENDAASRLRQMAEEAEQTSDYSDYDQACYDTWEHMSEAGSAFADTVEAYLGQQDAAAQELAAALAGFNEIAAWAAFESVAAASENHTALAQAAARMLAALGMTAVIRS